jgi:hypothetical protein
MLRRRADTPEAWQDLCRGTHALKISAAALEARNTLSRHNKD